MFIRILVLLILSSSLYAQQTTNGSLNGTVKTSDGQPASYVNIGLAGTGKGARVDEQGNFQIKNIRPGSYTLTASFVGLQTIEVAVEIKAGENTQIPEIILRENTTQLNEFVISERHLYKAEDPSPSLRIQTSILETPQSIVSISNEVIKNQQLLVMTDVAKNVSGVTTVYPDMGVHTDFAIRGTRAIQNRLRNGMAMTGYISLQEDMSYVESVEFIKGPAGFMLSQGEPGGMFNVVTKKPLNTNHASASLTTGSYGLFRTALDVGGPVGQKLFYRLNVMGQKSGTHIDYGIDDRFSLAPVIRYQANEKTTVTVEYNLDMVRIKSSLPLMPTVNHKPLPRSFSIDDPSIDPSVYRNQVAMINVQHEINDRWTLTAQAGYVNYRESNYQLFDWGTVGEDSLLNRFFRYIANKDQSANAQIFMNGNVVTGKLEHKILVGFDAGHYTNRMKYFAVDHAVLPVNVYDPYYGVGDTADTLIDESALNYFPTFLTAWQAVSFLDNIKINDWLQVSLGGRYTYFQSGYEGEYDTDKAFTPRAGVVVQPFKNTSFYFLYDQSFIQQGGVNFEREKFDPLTGNNIEFGFKREWFNKGLLTQLAIFQITKNNALTGDPEHPDFSIQRGQIVSKGVELDVMGSVNKNLSIIANYAYTDARITKDTDPAIKGMREAAPLHVINGWMKYDILSGKAKGLGFGLGGSYHKTRYMFTEFSYTKEEKQKNLPDLSNINAALFYKTGKLSLALNVDNLADKYNYIGYFDYNLGDDGEYRIMSLPGRNYMLTATINF